ncbi:MAG: hypothetical protein GEEBNDBF_01203 [bacterium]|nr:hypothetical protein [bacterium]
MDGGVHAKCNVAQGIRRQGETIRMLLPRYGDSPKCDRSVTCLVPQSRPGTLISLELLHHNATATSPTVDTRWQRVR